MTTARQRQLKRLRLGEQGRLRGLQRRVAETSPRHRAALAALQEGVADATKRLAEIEAELAGGEVEAVEVVTVVAAGGDGDADEARVVLRTRLQHLLGSLQRHAPPSCADAARRLEHGINAELRRLDRATNGR